MLSSTWAERIERAWCATCLCELPRRAFRASPCGLKELLASLGGQRVAQSLPAFHLRVHLVGVPAVDDAGLVELGVQSVLAVPPWRASRAPSRLAALAGAVFHEGVITMSLFIAMPGHKADAGAQRHRADRAAEQATTAPMTPPKAVLVGLVVAVPGIRRAIFHD